jgi:hypothetical protein
MACSSEGFWSFSLFCLRSMVDWNDPEMLRILLNPARYKPLYCPVKFKPVRSNGFRMINLAKLFKDYNAAGA